ncbi:cation diffusion facilitator family transporter [Bacteroidota bacterium]
MHVHTQNLRPDRLFAVGVALNLAYAGIEAGFGVLYDSLALIADAGHNLTDVVGLVLAWIGVVLGRSRPTGKRTYGFRKASILTALFSSLLIVMAMGVIAWEAVGRFGSQITPPGDTIMLVAGVGVVINVATALLFVGGRKHELNARGAFVHMLADAGVSAGVVVAGMAVVLTGWSWVDPVVSLVIAAIIVIGTWGLLRDSLHLAVDGVPRNVDLNAIRAFLSGIPGVKDVHDLHVWGSSTTETILTAHLNIGPQNDEIPVLKLASDGLNAKFGVGHTTLQIERNTPCPASKPCRPENEHQKAEHSHQDG